ncbi:MAG TPA: D-alanine--D-alanine ligase family protein [Candidatus Binatia bacterium]|nr:D-alanine--D-alanine ligase family protein [Candidatus Binatia bacterium]
MTPPPAAPNGRPDSGPVAVVFGGPSAEHDVSIVSGLAIARALAEGDRPVDLVLVDLERRWWWIPIAELGAPPDPARYDEPAELGAEGPLTAGEAVDRLARRASPPVVFIALHGPFGEDGTIQGLLEAAGLVYTGSGVGASAIGMDKPRFKRLVRGAGLPVVDWLEISRRRWLAEPTAVLAELEEFAAAHGEPRLMVKPAALGSSVGMTLAHGPAERGAALELAFRFDERALVERYLAGARELEVAVIGNEPSRLEAYGPGEVWPGREFYDYEAKYTPGLSKTTPRAELPAAMAARLRELAKATYAAVGAAGFARVDFLAVGEAVFVSEINTIPGFTPISLFPAMAATGGYDFRSVCERIVELALERAAERARPPLRPADLPRGVR